MKGIKFIAFTMLSATAMSFSLSAQAACPAPYGWYLEGNLGASKSSGVSYGSGSSVSSNGAGFNLNGGYKFNNYFGAELGYTKYADANIKDSTGTQAATSKHHSFDIAGKGIIPIQDAEVFAKVGAALINTNTSISNAAAASGLGISSSTKNQTGLYIGLGADYSITPNFPVILQWARSIGNSNTGNLDLLSLGVAYVFG